MKILRPSLEIRAEGGRLTSSAQPPRATPSSAHWFLPQPEAKSSPSISFLDAPDALLEGLRCFPAFRPLRYPRSEAGENVGALSSERNRK